MNNTSALVAVPDTARPSVCATGNGLLELTAVPPFSSLIPLLTSCAKYPVTIPILIPKQSYVFTVNDVRRPLVALPLKYKEPPLPAVVTASPDNVA